MKNYILFFFAFVAFSLNAQVNETRNVSTFNKIYGKTGVNISYYVANSPKILIETNKQENLQYIVTETKGNTLEVYVDTKNKRNVNISKIDVQVYGPVLKNIKMVSGSRLKIKDNMKTDELVVELSSGTRVHLGESFTTNDLTINLTSGSKLSGTIFSKNSSAKITSGSDWNSKITSTNFTIDISSGSDIKLEGETNLLNVNASSASRCYLEKLKSNEATLNAVSASKINSWVEKELSVTAKSTSKITIKGKPTVVSVHSDKVSKIKI